MGEGAGEVVRPGRLMTADYLEVYWAVLDGQKR